MKHRAATLFAAAIVAVCLAPRAHLQTDPLPSWSDGDVKRAIVAFVSRVTRAGAPDFVPMAERVAAFDHDGTLWVEKPLPTEVYFILARARALADRDPSLKTTQPFKAALEGDAAYFHEHGARAVVELFARTHSGMTQEQFAAEVARFLRDQRHPTLRRPFTETVYAPMLELLNYLRAAGFDLWICSGGTTDFMRVFALHVYDIPVDHVMGSDVRRDSRIVDARRVIWRLPGPAVLNDQDVKPVTIDQRVGRRPLFAAGNVGNAGDVAMLEYSKGRDGPSFQLMVNHDDAAREFAYAERDEVSLPAARKHGFTVASVKTDWKRVFLGPP
jgi:phosphoglycolate phosphatase-like HAD superfamily hydrolase